MRPLCISIGLAGVPGREQRRERGMQSVQQHPRLRIAVRPHDADTETHPALADRKRPAVATRRDVVAEPEHRLVLVVAGRVQLQLHADRAALVGRTQAGLAAEETGVAARVDDDAARSSSCAPWNGSRTRTPVNRSPRRERTLDVRLQPDLGAGVDRPRSRATGRSGVRRGHIRRRVR